MEIGFFNMTMPDQARWFTGTALQPFIGATRLMRKLHQLADGQSIIDLVRIHASIRKPLAITIRVTASDAQHEHQDLPFTEEHRRELVRAFRPLHKMDEFWYLVKHDLIAVQPGNEEVGNVAGTGGGVGWKHPSKYVETIEGHRLFYRSMRDNFGDDLCLLTPSLMEPNLLLLTNTRPGAAAPQRDFAMNMLHVGHEFGAEQAVHIQGGAPGVAERALDSLATFNMAAFGAIQRGQVPECSPAGIHEDDLRTPKNLEALALSQVRAILSYGGHRGHLRRIYVPGWCGGDLPERFRVACAMMPGNTERNEFIVGMWPRVLAAAGVGGEVEVGMRIMDGKPVGQ